MTRSPYKKISLRLKMFFETEASGGILLVFAALLSMIMSNTSAADVYHAFLNLELGFHAGDISLSKNMHHWINDGLMAVFFFMVGLEIKFEVVQGALSSRSKALLPAIAALGGMALPAIIYFILNRTTPENFQGWAIPSATDIAFALGILALLGNRVPPSLKILLMAIAVLDDLGAILIIALFYTDTLSGAGLSVAAICMSVLYMLNRAQIMRPSVYIVVGVIMWVAVLASGVHATLAGVLTALFIPLKKNREGESMLEHMIRALHPWVAFFIMPIFAFANAGVSLSGLSLSSLAAPVPLGIVLGLFIGKQAGIFGLLFVAIKTGLSPLPKDASWAQLYGVALLCGIGFTMSLFIGNLAFSTPATETGVRLGVLTGSLLSAIAGYFVLHSTSPTKGKRK